MKDVSRRPMPSETAQVNEEIPTFMQEGVKFAKLITAADNGACVFTLNGYICTYVAVFHRAFE